MSSVALSAEREKRTENMLLICTLRIDLIFCLHMHRLGCQLLLNIFSTRPISIDCAGGRGLKMLLNNFYILDLCR